MHKRSFVRVGLYATTVFLLLVAVAWAANFTINGNLIVNGDATTGKLTASEVHVLSGQTFINSSGINSTGDVSAANLNAVGKNLAGGTIKGLNVLAAGLVSGGSVQATSDVTSTSLKVSGSASLMKSYKVYAATISQGSPSTRPIEMGTWDICVLSTVIIAGEDGKPDDKATCGVTADSYNSTALRPSWTLTAGAGSTNVDLVTCGAICMSFSATSTGK